MSRNAAYLAALARAQEREANPKLAQKKEKAAAAKAVIESVCVSPASVSPAAPAVKPAQKDMTTTKYCLCHGDRPVDSHGICKQTVDAIRWTSRVPRGLSEEAQKKVEAIVQSGVIARAKNRRERAAEKEQVTPSSVQIERSSAQAMRDVRESISGKLADHKIEVTSELPEDVSFDDSAQRKYLASCILLRGMNFESGVRAAYPKLKPSEAAAVAFAAQKDKQLNDDIQEAASQRGLGEQDKQVYLGILWRYASSTRPQDFQDRGTALRLLGKAFIQEKTSSETPANLPIVGMEEGLARMGLDETTLKNVPTAVNVLDYDADEDDPE